MKLRELLILVILFTITALWMFTTFGVKTVNDSARYIEYANNLSEGFYFDTHNFWYLGYVIFLFILQIFTNNPDFVVACQYLISLFAFLSLAFASLKMMGKWIYALITSLLYCACFELVMWNSYILAESLLISFVCFVTLRLLIVQNKRTVANYLILIIVTLMAFLIKPTGIAILISMLASLCYRWLSKQPLLLKASFFTVFSIFSLILGNMMLSTFGLINNYSIGEVVYGVTSFHNYDQISYLIVSPPTNLVLPPEALSPLSRIVEFIIHHPIYWIRLFFTKVFYYVMHVRPYWSISHNLYNLMILFPMYSLSFLALWKGRLNIEIKVFSISYILLNILIIGFTSVDWDGRFFSPILPIIIILATKGLMILIPERIHAAIDG